MSELIWFTVGFVSVLLIITAADTIVRCFVKWWWHSPRWCWKPLPKAQHWRWVFFCFGKRKRTEISIHASWFLWRGHWNRPSCSRLCEIEWCERSHTTPSHIFDSFQHDFLFPSYLLCSDTILYGRESVRKHVSSLFLPGYNWGFEAYLDWSFRSTPGTSGSSSISLIHSLEKPDCSCQISSSLNHWLLPTSESRNRLRSEIFSSYPSQHPISYLLPIQLSWCFR